VKSFVKCLHQSYSRLPKAYRSLRDYFWIAKPKHKHKQSHRNHACFSR
jgi:hypothetical protein